MMQGFFYINKLRLVCMVMKTLLLVDNQDITREGMKAVAGRVGGLALVILRESAMLEEAEIPMARAMLRAAAFTYVASVLSTLTQLLRILLLARGRDRR